MTQSELVSRFSHSLAQLEQGAISCAREQLDSLVRELPHEPQVHFAHSVACVRGGDLRSCIESIHRVLSLDPGHQAARQLMTDLAAQGVPALLPDSPDGVRARSFVEKSTNHLAAGRSTQALILAEKAVSLRVFEPGYYYLYAVCLRSLHRNREAYDVLQKEIVFFPSNTPAVRMFEELRVAVLEQVPPQRSGLSPVALGSNHAPSLGAIE